MPAFLLVRSRFEVDVVDNYSVYIDFLGLEFQAELLF